MATKTTQHIDITENHLCLRYMEAVRKECQFIDFLETGVLDREVVISNPTSSDIYVTPHFSKDYIDAQRMEDGKLPNEAMTLTQVIEHKDYQYLFLKGDPGIGKTTLLRRIAYILSEPVTGKSFRQKLDNKLPILVVLRDIKLTDLSDFDVFLDRIFEQRYLRESKFQWNDEAKTTFKNLLQQGQIIFLLDGLDEITDERQRGELSNTLQEGINKYKDCFFWCTTRLTGFNQVDFWRSIIYFDINIQSNINEFSNNKNKPFKNLSSESIYEKKNLLSSLKDLFLNSSDNDKVDSKSFFKVEINHKNHSSAIKFPKFQELYLVPFDNSQIKKFMHQWCNLNFKAQYQADEFSEKFLKSLLLNTSVLHLARIPNMLTMMAMYYRINDRFPDGRYELYDKIVHSYLEIVDEKRNIATQHSIGPKNLRRCLGYLAFVMQEKRVKEGYQAMNVSIQEEEAKACFFNILKEESNADDLNDKVNDFFDAIKKRSDLLIERSDSHFAFLHLSIQEFLCAEYLQREWYKKMRRRNLDEHWQTLSRYTNNVAWQETLLLYFEAFRAIKEREKEDFTEAFEALCYDKQIKAERLCAHLLIDDYLEGFVAADLKEELITALVFYYLNHSLNFFPSNWIETHSKYWNGEDDIDDEKLKTIEWINLQNTSQLYLLKNVNTMTIFKAERLGLEDAQIAPILTPQTSMKYLSLDDNKLKNLVYIKEFKQLKYLSFDKNQVSDISVLSNLGNLWRLSFSNNQVNDISVLSNLGNLRELYFSNNQVNDISVLSNLGNLYWLNFSNNQVSDIRVLSNLGNLRELYFSNNQVNDISALSNLVNLNSLSFDNNQVSDIRVLSNLGNLKWLFFPNNQVSDIRALSNLGNLCRLTFSNNQVSDIRVLSNLGNLNSLSFDNNQVSDIRVLSNLVNLNSLSFFNNQVSDISVLKHLSNLSSLKFSNNQVSDISALSSLGNLRRLGFNNNQVNDIRALSNLGKLFWLYFSNNQVNDISALSSLGNLRVLHLSNNPIHDYSPIQSIYKKLKFKDFTIPEWD